MDRRLTHAVLLAIAIITTITLCQTAAEKQARVRARRDVGPAEPYDTVQPPVTIPRKRPNVPTTFTLPPLDFGGEPVDTQAPPPGIRSRPVQRRPFTLPPLDFGGEPVDTQAPPPGIRNRPVQRRPLTLPPFKFEPVDTQAPPRAGIRNRPEGGESRTLPPSDFLEPIDTTQPPLNFNPATPFIRLGPVFPIGDQPNLPPLANGDTQVTEAVDTPSQAPDLEGEADRNAASPPASDMFSGLPRLQNCIGVTCDVNTLQRCESPVLFTGECCPTCLQDQQACLRESCGINERCIVRSGRAICCTDLAARDRAQRDSGRRQQQVNTAGKYLNRLASRFPTTGNCPQRYLKPKEKHHESSPCRECTDWEVCEVRSASVWSHGIFRYRRPRHYCCLVERPDCPFLPRPSVLGKCHYPGRPAPTGSKNCQCTVYQSLSSAQLARAVFLRDTAHRYSNAYTTIRFITGEFRGLEVEFCGCLRNAESHFHVSGSGGRTPPSADATPRYQQNNCRRVPGSLSPFGK